MPNGYELDNFFTGTSQGSMISKKQELAIAAHQQRYNGNKTSIADTTNDVLWGYQSPVKPDPPHSYFDYYFAGQDIKVYMEGVREGDGDLPIMDFAFNIQQQKTPVYGFWNYTYSTVMRGTRIVTGQFRIATTRADYMTKMISEAANSRTIANAFSPVRTLDEDEKNIEKYWTRNIDPDTIGYKHIFSSHPPFNFYLVYGIQDISISPVGADKYDALYEQYKSNDNQLVLNTNHRLVEADPNNYTMRMVIDSVEITQLQVEYTTDGSVCAEVYSFFARDMRNVDTSNVSNH